MTTTGSGQTPPEPGPQDAELLELLGAVLSRTAAPPELMDRARQAFEFRAIDAELAALVFDSDDVDVSGADRELLTVRRSSPSEVRRLVFEPADERLSLELTLTPAAGRYRVEGHVLPLGPVAVEIWHGCDLARLPVTADSLGGFVAEGIEPGPIRVSCRRPGEDPVHSEWLLLD